MTQIELPYELRVNDEYLIESLFNNTNPHEPEIHELLDPLNQNLTTENKYYQFKTFAKAKLISTQPLRLD